jgi:ABC-type glutathione transport system ATPase component
MHLLIRNICEESKKGALVISHDMEGALKTADRLLVIDAGKVVDEGTPSQIEKSKHPLTHSFLETFKERKNEGR